MVLHSSPLEKRHGPDPPPQMELSRFHRVVDRMDDLVERRFARCQHRHPGDMRFARRLFLVSCDALAVSPHGHVAASKSARFDRRVIMSAGCYRSVRQTHKASYPANAGIQYAAAVVARHRFPGVLGHPQEPVIGRRAAPTRWRVTTLE